MEVIHDPKAMAAWSAGQRRAGRHVGFVPTMGALHQGHVSLVHRARSYTDAVVASIFVNPLQFNNPEDLAKYPRTPESDHALLAAGGCDAVFVPDQAGIYAGHQPVRYDIGALGSVWEGPSRPGHFDGMLNVVERLFHYVRPDSAFFGEKDRQQLAIVTATAGCLRWPVRIVGCPTVREADGLAMSSRNARLGRDDRRAAPVLFKALERIGEGAFVRAVSECLKAGEDTIAREQRVQLDYLGIVEPLSLQPIHSWDGLQQAVALVAAQVGPVRLIDNVTLQRPAGTHRPG